MGWTKLGFIAVATALLMATAGPSQSAAQAPAAAAVKAAGLENALG